MTCNSRHLHNHPALRSRRKELRQQLTPAEARLWTALRRRQLHGRKFRRQHSIGPYVVDFYCPGEQLVIEVDGAVHDDPLRAAYDAERQTFLEAQDLTMVRVTNEEVRNQLPAVLTWIARHFAG